MITHARILFVFFTCFCVRSIAQPATEVYLFDLTKNKSGYSLSNPINVSNNPGYDNQPSFSHENRILFYTSQQADGQTDIIRYDIARKTGKRFTSSEGSEYSPTVTAAGDAVSTIILKKNGEQLLWKYDLVNGEAAVLVPDLVIGYHCWYDENTLFSFVLGEISTLQKNNLNSRTNTVIDQNIGRALHRIPGKKEISYISKAAEEWKIMAYRVKTGEQKVLAETLPSSEDMAWTPDRTMIMGSGSQLYYRGLKDKSWSLLVDLKKFDLSGITRIAISPDGQKIAVVVEE